MGFRSYRGYTIDCVFITLQRIYLFFHQIFISEAVSLIFVFVNLILRRQFLIARKIIPLFEQIHKHQKLYIK